MPLRCVDEHGTIIEANACTDQEWTRLRERARKERQLRMPCCPARAVLKTSRLGTRFFAHKAKGTCTWKTETAAHLHLRRLRSTRPAKRDGRLRRRSRDAPLTAEKWTADMLAWEGRGESRR